MPCPPHRLQAGFAGYVQIMEVFYLTNDNNNKNNESKEGAGLYGRVKAPSTANKETPCGEAAAGKARGPGDWRRNGAAGAGAERAGPPARHSAAISAAKRARAACQAAVAAAGLPGGGRVAAAPARPSGCQPQDSRRFAGTEAHGAAAGSSAGGAEAAAAPQSGKKSGGKTVC